MKYITGEKTAMDKAVTKIRKIEINTEDYPELLRHIQNPPKTVYGKGNILHKYNRESSLKDFFNKNFFIAIVGSRKSSAYGRWAAYELGKLAGKNGIVIVSGMASGIDTWAHKGALDGGGKTIAVLGCGVDVCYPKSNKQLMERIVEQGAVISEFSPEVQPRPYHFPLRNRLISGISKAVIVVEAGIKSGSLITAEWAAEQGRDVYAVPGNITNSNSFGSNKLLQEGAAPILHIDDILSIAGMANIPPDIKENDIGKDEKEIIKIILQNGECTFDFLHEITGKTAAEISSLITIMEIKGILFTSFGKIFIAKN